MVDIRSVDIPSDPEEALASVVALRRLADQIEREAVRSALKQGWSWSRIAQGLGVTKQAAHKRLSDVTSDETFR